MRAVFIGLGVLVVLLLGLVFVVPSLVPSETYRTRIQEQLSSELGREVEISGDVSLSTFPTIRAKTGAVRVANPDGFTGPDLASLSGLEAKVRLLPLLSRRVEIKSFTLKQPTILLERRADGAVNWTLGDTQDMTAPAEGPFRRDGRYTDMSPSIRAFNIEDGTLRYTDRVAGTDVSLTALNAFLSLPALDGTLVVDGSAAVDGRPVNVDLSLESVKAFLSGREAALKGDIETDGARVTVDGAFPASTDIAFAGRVDGEITDAQGLAVALADWLPDTPYLSALSSGAFSGTVDYAGKAFALTDGDVALRGPAGTASFKGDARHDGAPVLDGGFSADVTDVQALRPLLPKPVPGFELLRTATVSADLEAAGDDAFDMKDVDASVTGDGLDATFQGTGRYAEALSLDGQFTANAQNPSKVAALVAPDVKGVGALGATTAMGRVSLDGSVIAVSDLNAKTSGEQLNGSFTGAVRSGGDTVTAKGQFDITVPDAGAALRAAQLDVEPEVVADAAVAGRIEATGALAYDGTTASISDLVAQSTSAVQSASYRGTVRYADAVALDGTFDATVPDLAALDAALSAQIPYTDAVTRLAARGTVKGPTDALAITDLRATMTEGLLNGEYAGAARVAGETVALDGTLNASGNSLRALAATRGTVLPPSTAKGTVFEAFALSGRVGGTTAALALDDATLTLDALRGTGAFVLDMAGARPKLSGTLDMGALDLRPYMNAYSAQNPTGQIQPWSREPLPVEGLRSVDAELDLKASSVKLTRLSLGPTTMDVTLKDGRLSGDIPALSLYGGKGRAAFALDASGAVPRVSLNASLGDLESQGFLGAVAGFAKATGTAGTSVNITGSGLSQADIMASLDGTGDFKVLNGSIQGIDAQAFLTGLDTALRSRALPGGIGADYQTKFRDLLGAFTVTDGVARIDRFTLDGLGVAVEGSGAVDLGAQTIDFRFRPRATGDAARGIAAFGVPVRFSGGFGSAKAGLDAEFLGQIAAERARLEASRAVRDRVGGPVGDIIGGVIGGSSPASGGAEQPTTPRDAVGGVLGGILGGGSKPSTPAPDPTPTETPATPPTPPAEQADSVEDAVLGIFGIRKPKAKPKPQETPAPAGD